MTSSVQEERRYRSLFLVAEDVPGPGQPSQTQDGISHRRPVLPKGMGPSGMSFQRALLGGPTPPVRLPEGVPDANQEFLAVLAQLVGKIPRWDPRQRGRVPYE